MTGYAELDTAGRWETAGDYGEVWYPDGLAGWVPYSDGRWIWVEPWGWTWIDAAPWGFATTHYGRWAFIDGRWGWVPGTPEPYPAYAPALVGFLGGAGVGLYVAGAVGPQVGWFPLAPGEVYWPAYTRNLNYIRNINIANVRNTGSIQIHGAPPRRLAATQFANRRFATVVPRQIFAAGGRVEPAARRLPAPALERVSVSDRPPHIRVVPGPRVPGPAPFVQRAPPDQRLGTQGGHGLPACPTQPSSRRIQRLAAAHCGSSPRQTQALRARSSVRAANCLMKGALRRRRKPAPVKEIIRLRPVHYTRGRQCIRSGCLNGKPVCPL